MPAQSNIERELANHFFDLVDEYIAHGSTPEHAATQARQQLGDTASTITQLAPAEHTRSTLIRSTIILGVVLYGTLGFILLLLRFFNTNTAQLITLWWYGIGIVLLNIVIQTWIIRYCGLRSWRVIWWSIATLILLIVSSTIVLNVNQFEVILHNLIVLVISVFVLFLIWARLPVYGKRLALLTISTWCVSSALLDIRLLSWLLPNSCFYIINTAPFGTPPATCVQIPWYSLPLWPLYLIIAASLLIYLVNLLHYWRTSGIAVYKKITFTLVLLGCIVLPLQLHNVNSKGELDIVPWKQNINDTYLSILGRSPQDKDYEFYSYTRSYENMLQVRDVLYASRERRLKIKLLFLEILHRAATKPEVHHYVQSRASIYQIEQELQAY